MLNKKRGGLNMIDVGIFYNSKQINLLYRIIHSKKEAWNVISKHWLQGLDRKYQENFFLCRCTSTEGLNIPEMSTFYVKTLNTWTKFISYVNPSSKQDAYEEQLSGNKNITFNGKPLFMSNFAKSGFKRVKDLYLQNTMFLLSSDVIYNRLQYRGNWISVWYKVKSALQNYQRKVESDFNNIENRVNVKLDNLWFYNSKGSKVLKLSTNQIKEIYLLNKNPKCEKKWNEFFDKELKWKNIWNNSQKCLVPNKVKDLQWKLLHRIIYTEELLHKMNKSNGKCHFRTDYVENIEHLFYDCERSKEFLSLVFAMMNFVEPRSNNHVEFTFSKFNVIFGFATKEIFSNVCNSIVFMAKWEIWKERNIVKYQKKNSTCFTMFKRFQWNVINYINIVLLAYFRNINLCLWEEIKRKIELFHVHM